MDGCRVAAALASLAWAGCSFDVTGHGSSEGGSDGGSTGDGPTSTHAGSASDSTAGSGDSDSDPSAESDSDPSTSGPTGGTEEGPLLQISDAPVYDFGLVDVGTDAAHTFTVTNIGAQMATSIVAIDLGARFSYGNNTCGDTLPPGDSCAIQARVRPVVFGALSETLRVEYGPVAASTGVDLTAAGAGTTENLLVNGDAEDGGNPPAGWTEIMGDTWEADDYSRTDGIPSHGGDNAIFGGRDASVDGELAQDVDLGEWADLVEAGEIRVNFDGWARSYYDAGDPYQIVVEFRDMQGQVVGPPLLETDFNLGVTWTRYMDSATPMPDARGLRVRLLCDLSGIWCDSFFDDLVVSVTYAP